MTALNQFLALTFSVLLIGIIPFFKPLFGQQKRGTVSVNHPSWAKDAVIYEVNIRQYTPEGTFKAFESHLPRLKNMGVDILWLMPIHPIGEKNRKGGLGSYYAVKDYTAVNPEFGSNEDFRHLVEAIHARGMKVIIDWVANHTAWDHIWTESHPSWYTTDEVGQFVPPVEDWSDVIDLDYEHPEMRSAMIDALKYWVDQYNIDGYRCDVAGMVPLNFWLEARVALDVIKPVFMLAEDEGPLMHQAFDMTYAWELHHLFNKIAQGEATAADLDAYWAEERERFPADAYRMLFTSNHDENSWNGTVQERLGPAAEVMAVLSGTLPGMPLIYSGQEAGLDRRLSFFEKDEISWQDHPMADLYQILNQLKKENPALWNGKAGGNMTRLEAPNANAFYGFVRSKGKAQVMVIANLSDQPLQAKVRTKSFKGEWEEVLPKGPTQTIKGKLKTTLEPWGYRVWSRKSQE